MCPPRYWGSSGGRTFSRRRIIRDGVFRNAPTWIDSRLQRTVHRGQPAHEERLAFGSRFFRLLAAAGHFRDFCDEGIEFQAFKISLGYLVHRLIQDLDFGLARLVAVADLAVAFEAPRVRGLFCLGLYVVERGSAVRPLSKDQLSEQVEVIFPDGEDMRAGIDVPDVGHVVCLEIGVKALADIDQRVLIASGDPEQL